MRLPSIPRLLTRTLYTVSSPTFRALPQQLRSLHPLLNPPAFPRPHLLSMNISMPSLSSLFGSSSSKNMSFPVEKSKDEWRAQLSPQQFKVIREKGTESPYTGKYDQHYPDANGPGVYGCAACGAPLYKAQHKFKSGCGWPAFFDAIPGAVTQHVDRSLGMIRNEIICTNCGGHLGHIFRGEGYANPTNERHCVNSVSLSFTETGEAADAEKKTDETARV